MDAVRFQTGKLHLGIDIRRRILKIIRRINRKHQHINQPGLHRTQSRFRIVRAQAQEANLSLRLQGLGILDNIGLKNRRIILCGIHIVNHTDINILSLQPGKHILK